ncbi:TnsA-like heteromeric transposase endonuclease subunit [Streptomyces sp. NPDC013099]|uniref:TnsA-like heteromeric transposase endonuclease subunit n=1 Tax=unclassified Streptomyces TaxID=2593676 RepID=UPI002DD42563|nr:TnsA-like heteromeric transposase endonuclease subunit [Streptomyces sp. SL294]
MTADAFAAVGHGVWEVEYVDEGHVRRREPLSAVWTARFELLPPVRKVRTYDGQRSVTRDYWPTTMRRALVCESRLERDHAMLMDFDSQVTGLESQPFRLFWPTRRGRLGHVPDFFARRSDGGGVVVDVCPEDQIEAGDAEAFAATGRVCELAGASSNSSARYSLHACIPVGGSLWPLRDPQAAGLDDDEDGGQAGLTGRWVRGRTRRVPCRT